jgi:hypothetical protein
MENNSKERSPQIQEDFVYVKVKEMFPDAPESFILAMYHNIKGKQYLWRDKDMNDNSILNSE